MSITLNPFILFALLIIILFFQLTYCLTDYDLTPITDIPTTIDCTLEYRFYIRLFSSNRLYFSNTCEDIELTLDTYTTITTFPFFSTNAQGTLFPIIMKSEDSKPKFLISKESGFLKVFELSSPYTFYPIEFGEDLNGLYQLSEFTFLLSVTKSFPDFPNRIRTDSLIAIFQINQKTQSIIIAKEIILTGISTASAIPLLDGNILILSILEPLKQLEGRFCDRTDLMCADPFSLGLALTIINTYFLSVELDNQVLMACALDSNLKVVCFAAAYDVNANSMTLTPNQAVSVLSDCSSQRKNYFSFFKINKITMIHSCGAEELKIQRFDKNFNLINSPIVINNGGIYHDYITTPSGSLIIISSALKAAGTGHRYSVQTLAFPLCDDVTTYVTKATPSAVFPFSKTIAFVSFPTFIRKTSDQTPCGQFISYSPSDIELYTTTPRSFHIYYSIAEPDSANQLILSNACTLYIKECYVSCSKCIKGGSSLKHECTECKSSYHFIENTSNCISTSDYNTYYSNYYLDNTAMIYKKCHPYCKTCTALGNSINSKCTQCTTGFFRLETESDNCIGKCPAGYYGDTSTPPNTCRKCYNTCKTCSALGSNTNHLCDSCFRNFVFATNNPNPAIKNCVPKCRINEYWYKELTEVYCLTTGECPSQYPYVIKDTLQCVTACPHPTLIYLTKCYSTCPTGTKETLNSQICTPAIDGIDPPITNDSTNSVNMDTDLSKEDIMNQIGDVIDLGLLSTEKNKTTVITGDDFKFAMYDTNTAVSNGLKIPKVNIGACETILRNHYHIPSKESLKIGQMSYDKSDAAIDKIQYSIYRENGEELDLSLCEGTDMTTQYPINTDLPGLDFDYASELSKKGINIFDVNSDIFNDKCTVFSEDGKDLTVNDRRDKVFGNFSMCEEGCTMESIDFETQFANCTCKPQPNGLKTIIESNELINQFTSLISDTNLPLFLCINAITLEGFITNIGNIMMIVFILIDVIAYAIFSFVQLKQIYKVINVNCLSAPTKKEKKNNLTKLHSYSKESDSIIRGIKNIQEEKREEDKAVEDLDEGGEGKNKVEYQSVELNEMDYADVKMYDKRHLCKYYIDILIQKHIILSTLFNASLFYPITLRIILFIFSFSLFFFFNAIFYTDEYISKRSEMTGDLGFIYILENEFEKSIYASLISMALGKLLSMLTSIGIDYYRLLRTKGDDRFQFRLYILLNEMKKRMIIVGVAVFIFDLVFWYFLFIFCTIYQNNQIGWIESTFISIAINMLIPICLCLIIAILRYCGLCMKST